MRHKKNTTGNFHMSYDFVLSELRLKTVAAWRRGPIGAEIKFSCLLLLPPIGIANGAKFALKSSILCYNTSSFLCSQSRQSFAMHSFPRASAEKCTKFPRAFEDMPNKSLKRFFIHNEMIEK